MAYVTCSPHLSETRAVVADVVKRHSIVKVLDARDYLPEVTTLGEGPLCSCGRTVTTLTRCFWPCCASRGLIALAPPEHTGGVGSLARMDVQIAPSILSADFARLAEEIARVENADWVHVDVMDAHFVPNLTLGLPVVESLAKAVASAPGLPLHDRGPGSLGSGLRRSGRSERHVPHRGCKRADPTRAHAARAGSRAGIALNPATPADALDDLLNEVDMVLLMTVEPGFGAQRFLDVVLPKVHRVREAIDRRGGEVWLQVDGGISLDTIERCAEAGADVFVAGLGGLWSRRAVRDRRVAAKCGPSACARAT